MNTIFELTTAIKQNIAQVIIGKEDAIELLLVSLFCEGHVLLEDVPGVGKTMLARALAASLGGEFKRVQCTPDLLPNDITGVSIYSQNSGAFLFRPGPIFGNVLLADEINRATPRTQSALLEAMQESQVTVDGVTHQLPRPFMVLATQNPIEYEGTFPLPEAQLDRFFMRLSLGYPDRAEEKHLLTHLQREHPIERITAVTTPEAVQSAQRQVWDIYLEDSLKDYIVEIIAATRAHNELRLGASPRASLALSKAAQALAALRGRDHVLPDDIQKLAEPVLIHRVLLEPDAQLRGITAAGIIRAIIEKTPLQLNG